jgi:hypothetical protein
VSPSLTFITINHVVTLKANVIEDDEEDDGTGEYFNVVKPAVHGRVQNDSSV